jgi:tetratricopeptide (TPR) repeat protein
MVRLGTEAIDVPPGESDYRLGDRFVLPVDVEALSIYPHAHYLGSEVRAFATLPDGAREWLIWIDDWDFRWQDVYELDPPLALPAGTAIEVEFAWDNSAANPHNPHRPPRRVRHGPRSDDEMGNLWMQVVPRDPGDAGRLEEAVQVHYAGVVAGGLRARLRDAPDDAALHAELADLLARRGDLEPAAEHYRRTVALDPASAAAQNNLAAVLSRLGQWDQAVVHYREAARLEPGIASIRVNLAGALIAVDRLDEAAAELREALRLAPGHPEALRRLALVLERLGEGGR